MAGMLQRSARLAWIFWILVSVLAAVLGALVAWRIRLLILRGPAFTQDLLHDLGTVVEALILSGAQWLVLRRFRVDAYWWVPASVSAGLVNATIVIPTTLRVLVAPSLGPESLAAAVLSSAVAGATAGLVLGAAQALVLRTSGRYAAWAWIPATVVGAAVAGALTTALAFQVLRPPAVGFIAVVAALGALFPAAGQAPRPLTPSRQTAVVTPAYSYRRT